jgi:hypothetical protein
LKFLQVSFPYNDFSISESQEEEAQIVIAKPSSIRGCNGEMDQIFFPSKSSENQGSYQDSVEKE